MDWFSCSMEELLREVQVEETLPVEARNNIKQNFYSAPEEPQKLFADAAEEIMGTYNAAANLHAPFEAEWQAEEALDKQTVPVEAENIEQSFYFEPDDELQLLLAAIDEATAEQQRQAISTNDKSSMVQNKPSFFDPFEAAWRAEEALENEKRHNAAANLHAGPLGGHNDLSRLQLYIESDVEILIKVYMRILTRWYIYDRHGCTPEQFAPLAHASYNSCCS